jgi:tRNA threonylcarbamoyladenosine biosynthesis protein TsaE
MTIETDLSSLEKVIEPLNDLIAHDANCIVLLIGDLASGKTTLVKEFVRSRDIDSTVTSPTFSIQQIYGNSIFHYDLYNKTIEEFLALGLIEEFEKEGIHFVEWADESLKNILIEYGYDIIQIQIEKLQNSRRYEIIKF